MKKLAVLAAVLFAFAAAAVDAPKAPVKMEAKQGTVTYDHSKHAALKCDTCHKGAPGKIAGLNKDNGHKMCQECHKAEKKGPQKCADCHKK